MQPVRTIQSRYATQMVNNKYFTTLTMSGNTSPVVGNKGGLNQGYIFVPYIMQQATPIIDEGPWWREMQRRRLRRERKEKIMKLGWL